MSTLSLFEDFSGHGAKAIRSGSDDLIDDPLEGYETGYKAGWKDATKAHRDNCTHLASALSRNLEQIEFTMVEAQNHVLSALRPVLAEIANTLLPQLSKQALDQLLRSEIDPLLKELAPSEISLAVSPNDKAPIAKLLSRTPGLSAVPLVAKETIGEGQVYITCPSSNRKVDVNAAIGEIQMRLDSFLQQPELEHADVV